jgi:ComF family protein
MLTALQNLVFPPVCSLCMRRTPQEYGGACAVCVGELQPIISPFCSGCGGTIDGILDVCGECLQFDRPWEGAVSVYEFGGTARELVHRFKYGSDITVGGFLAQQAAEAWAGRGGDATLVTAVPLHWGRQRKRGYNQAELLARDVAGHLGLNYASLLRRTRRSIPQAQLNLKQRQQNLKGAFAAVGSVEEGAHVLLVDDVLTTGATLGGCTEVLLAAGAAKVSVLTVARG